MSTTSLRPLPAPLAAQALARPAHPALLHGGGAVTYRVLAAQAAAGAAVLAAAGVRPGTRVALAAAPTPAAVGALHALWWLGAVPVPLPARGAPADGAARLAAAEPAFWLRHGDEDEAQDYLAACGLPVVNVRSACATAAEFLPAAAPWAQDAPLAVVTTSGSTGAPKPVVLHVGQVVFSAFGSATRLGHLPGDVWAATLPWHHVGGLAVLLRALLFGTTVRLAPRFDATRLAAELEAGEVSLVSLVPTMLARLLDEAPSLRPHATLRAVLLGGAPADDGCVARARSLGLPVVRTWGMSEAASQVATQWPGAADAGPGDAGPPLPFVHVRRAEDGRLHVDGPVVAAPERTGDVGELLAGGEVAVHGRADDVFISGGVNVHPGPIEACLLRHPALAEAAVVAVPDATWGQRAAAHLVAQAGVARPDDAELLAFCRARLASFQLPVQFEWHDRLPRDALGKLRRRDLAAAAARPRSP